MWQAVLWMPLLVLVGLVAARQWTALVGAGVWAIFVEAVYHVLRAFLPEAMAARGRAAAPLSAPDAWICALPMYTGGHSPGVPGRTSFLSFLFGFYLPVSPGSTSVWSLVAFFALTAALLLDAGTAVALGCHGTSSRAEIPAWVLVSMGGAAVAGGLYRRALRRERARAVCRPAAAAAGTAT